MDNRFLAADLYDYLRSLSSLLDGIGKRDAAERVFHVSKFATGSSSELFGEAKLLLPEILTECGDQMSEEDCASLRRAIAGIEAEFTRIGGA